MIKQSVWLMKMRKAERNKNQEMRKEYRRKIWRSGYWITADLNLISWDKIEKSHAENIYRMLERKAERYISKTISAYYGGLQPRGDGAQDAYDQELSYFENEVTAIGIVRSHVFYPWLIKRLAMENE